MTQSTQIEKGDESQDCQSVTVALTFEKVGCRRLIRQPTGPADGKIMFASGYTISGTSDPLSSSLVKECRFESTVKCKII